jgi:hypothetical protein
VNLQLQLLHHLIVPIVSLNLQISNREQMNYKPLRGKQRPHERQSVMHVRLKITHLAYLVVRGPNVPQNFHEATKGPSADVWWDAMCEEIAMLTRQETWVIEELPKGRKEIGCQWTYNIKYGPSGEVL